MDCEPSDTPIITIYLSFMKIKLLITFIAILFNNILFASDVEIIQCKYELFGESKYDGYKGKGELRCLASETLGFNLRLLNEEMEGLASIISDKNSSNFPPIECTTYRIVGNNKEYFITYSPNNFSITAYDNNFYVIVKTKYGRYVISISKEGYVKLRTIIEEAKTLEHFNKISISDDIAFEQLKQDGFWIEYIYPDIDISGFSIWDLLLF